MRFTVLGAGVMGTLYATRLAAAGHQVTVVARGARVEALRRTGLRVRRRGTDEVMAVPVREVAARDPLPPPAGATKAAVAAPTSAARAAPESAAATGPATAAATVAATVAASAAATGPATAAATVAASPAATGPASPAVALAASTAPSARLARSLATAGEADAVLVFLRAQQVDAVLPELRACATDVVMLANTAAGYGAWREALGERLLAGFPGATGRFDADGAVEYELAPRLLQPTVLGEPSGQRTPRLSALASALRSAGFPVQERADLERWIRTHAAWIAPFILTAAAAGSANRLASAPLVRRCIAATFEALRAVRAQGPLVPGLYRALLFVPAWLAVAAVRLALSPSRALREHLYAAGAPLADEGRALAQALLRDAGRPLPALASLLGDSESPR